MAVELAGYHGWTAERRPAAFAAWPIARTAIVLVVRRRMFWVLLGFALINFLFHFAIIYFKAEVIARRPQVARFLDQILVTGRGDTYRDFMAAQGVVTMLLLAFAGAQMVGGDYQRGVMAFYLGRRLGRLHYIVGKLTAIAALVATITTIPTLLLFAEYGFLTDGIAYFRAEHRILWGILGYGGVLMLVLSLLVAALAAVLQRTVPLVMVWTGVFVFLPVLSELLRFLQHQVFWRLLDLWRDMQLLGDWCFGALDNQSEWDRLPWAAVVCLTLTVVSTGVLLHRVKAIEIVR